MNSPADIENLNPEKLPPKLPLLQMFRVGLFQMGLGIMSLLVAGLLNRLMINELAIPATLTAIFISMPLFVSPARVWFGQTSDAKTIWGTHRSGYVWIGAVLFAIAAFLTTQVMWQLGRSVYEIGWNGITYGWVVLLAAMFGLYGMAISLSSTPFAAMLVDISDEEERSKLVGIVWSMLMVGIVIGAITVSRLLPCTGAPPNEVSLFANGDRLATLQKAINLVFVIIPAAVIGLAVFATYGIEQKYSRYKLRVAQNDLIHGKTEDKLSLVNALRVLTASRQTGLFFVFLLLMTIGIFMQDAIMEPYGGAVFGMSICATTQLNAAFGMGTLVGLSSAGFLVVPRLGKERATRIGCYLVAASCVFLIISGFIQKTWALQASLALFGLTSGITTSGALSLMLDLTAAETAGTFIGAWGLSQAVARGLATVTGGIVLDIGKRIFSTSTLAYSFVFICEALVMVAAVTLLSRVNVQEFRTDAKRAIATVFANEID
ncbi:BCD family MFS transporter [Pseudanabaena sp. FACHB-1277]|uniref:BCD family MFS transporter n=1 Tax=Pseudanabaena cinerea FACHB-1277 TaxID=2949581 RepID=A0A926Z695_9CYAN|nr:BCD family MFS transporter [Pseudanabaena cinerea]MBD2150453.1 BCD family MFS transporter [Pseudanabaena cinerea FACHB-1277]